MDTPQGFQVCRLGVDFRLGDSASRGEQSAVDGASQTVFCRTYELC